MISSRPPRRAGASVYSNFDHQLDAEVVAELEADAGLYAQHAAWDFCGYVWRGADGVWRDEVWQYKEPVEVIDGDSAAEVISGANEKFGSD